MMRLWQHIANAWREPAFWQQPMHLPPFGPAGTRGDREQLANDFPTFVEHAYKANGVVWTCVLVRLLVLSEARFLWRRFRDGRPTALFGNQDLALLERPWPNGTTGELIAHMEQDVSLAGNFYATVVDEGETRRVRRLRPDWVTIVTGSTSDDPFALDARPVGYIYHPNRSGGVARGVGGADEPVVLTPDQVVHWSPLPDPMAQWRGMSWVTPVVREVQADSAATEHKLGFFRRGATPGFAISYDRSTTKEEVREYIELFKEQFDGAENAWRTLHLGGGAEPHTVSSSFRDIDYKATVGLGETRIIQAAGLHPVVTSSSEGMQGASLNAGNFNSARRRVADGTFRPLWRSMAAALESLVAPPDGAHLWYDDRDVAFLRQDAKDEAEVKQLEAATLNELVTTGFTPESAIAAIQTGDLRLLEHTGLVSVQLQPPGLGGDSEPVDVPANQAGRLLAEGWTRPTNGHRPVPVPRS